MRLTKYGHACVRLEKDGKVVVIDPGTLSEAAALDGADAVLITHQHFDHVDVERLRSASSELEVWTCEGVAGELTDVPPKVRVVRHGDDFTAAGFAVRVYGEWHARNHPDMPIVQNVGFLLDDEVFYPGDALTVPDVEVPTLLVPTNAPWLKGLEMVEYLRTVRPARAYSTHDGLLNDAGLSLVDGWLKLEADKQGADMRRLAVGESVTLG
ncbi:MBL fold metallo-hydrolase [Nonomuraea muscovyensis]|uniref:L-ascorbate metabolism protein UlaG (Beta-lactamase superfamily) n=1 Tax=Nonomuraea muscovyensis TaxID=1124761 RepID=A0A7X0CBG7_9ACTN|nr:MBL fold metallo-hydrolase [Nonomuraea muscovyensis]MBB6351593.1 L-ascorbate metabolism protein UlaG (beta-lactamase superfamily) [Nonomuraea muscovyensis]